MKSLALLLARGAPDAGLQKKAQQKDGAYIFRVQEFATGEVASQWEVNRVLPVPSVCVVGVEQAGTQVSGGMEGDSVVTLSIHHPAVTEALQAPGKIPGCSGTRNLHDNLSDLRAQVAANQKGIQLVGELIGQYGLDVVQAYMGHIQVGLRASWGSVVAPR